MCIKEFETLCVLGGHSAVSMCYTNPCTYVDIVIVPQCPALRMSTAQRHRPALAGSALTLAPSAPVAVGAFNVKFANIDRCAFVLRAT